MKLSELHTGERGVIVKVYGHGGFRKRIVEMGFVRGKSVKVLLNAPLHDPIEYELLGYKISLRREEAALVEVISEGEARELPALGGAEKLPALEPDSSDKEEMARLMRRMQMLADERRRVIKVALVGNPNCGKTSLFNIASGSHEHVGNYSGVTVGSVEGAFHFGGYRFRLVDLPGTYSLSAYSPEERFVRRTLIEDMPDVVINVVDATNLERNLYLTAQLIDMNLTMVVALNMYDEVRAHGDQLDFKTLGQLLGVPMVPTVSRGGTGVDELFRTVIAVYEGAAPDLARHIHINHGAELERSIDAVKAAFQKNKEIRYKYSTRYLALKFLEGDAEVDRVVEALPNRDELIAVRYAEQRRIREELHETAESALVDAKYGFIAGALRETYRPHARKPHRDTVTGRIDAVVTNRYLGFPLFFFLLFLMFEATFVLGDYPMQGIEWVVERFGCFVAENMREGPLASLVQDGVIAGVGSVIVFLPNILLLYFFISVLEDTGYMARAAFIMDKVMHRMGLHGKSFIPMIMGFGCNVPAVMATRTIENPKSRLVTMLVTPLMSCSARLPIYIILVGAFFPDHAGLVLLSLYAFGILMAVLVARVLSRRLMRGMDLPFVMELPPYRVPTLRSALRHTWEKGRQYLRKMAGLILAFSILVWVLDYFPRGAADLTPKERQEQSYIGRMGRCVQPLLAPLGFDWKMTVGILSGVGAKELVVSTLGVMYAVPQDGGAPSAPAGTSVGADAGEAAEAARSAGTTARAEEDAPEADMLLQRAMLKAISPAAALSYMVFVLLYFPCIATLVVIRNESGSWKWAFRTAVYTTLLAYACSFLVYRLAMLWT